MRIINQTLCVLALTAILFSCEKEKSFDPSTVGQGGTISNIQGDWKFMGVTAKTTVTLSGVEPGVGSIKTVSISDYTSTNNVGTVKIEAAKMTGIGLGYDVDLIAKGYYYENNVLEDSLEMPMFIQMPPISSSAPYKRVGNDSLYFQGGSFFSPATGGSGVSQPNGAKIKLEGDKLIMMMKLNESKTVDTLGVRLNQVSLAETSVTLQKL